MRISESKRGACIAYDASRSPKYSTVRQTLGGERRCGVFAGMS